MFPINNFQLLNTCTKQAYNINPKFLFFSAGLSNSLPMALSEIAAHTDIKRDSSFLFISLEARKTKITSSISTGN